MLLFGEAGVLTADEPDTSLPLVSTVYTKIGGVLTQQRGDVLVQKYFRKSKKGVTTPPAREGLKKCGATIRQPGLCQVRMKITRTVAAPGTITIERLDSEEHQHDLERSREIAPSNLAVQLLRWKRKKDMQLHRF